MSKTKGGLLWGEASVITNEITSVFGNLDNNPSAIIPP